MKILLLSLALIYTSLLSGCAHNPDKDKPWKRTEPKWYQSDMDNQDRDFFLGFFYNH